MEFQIALEDIDVAAAKESLQDPRAGACVEFEGWVRNENEGREVLNLEYEAYEAMALKEGRKILEEARGKFPILEAVCIHRVGHLRIGDVAVWVGVSAGHRGEAFDACRYIIDETKHRVPIWKKEYYTDGDSGWVRCEHCAEVGHKHDR